MVLLRFNKSIKKWDIINQVNKKEGDLYLDGFLKDKLDFARKQRAKNNDVVGIICGDEGSGKSTAAGNIMRYVTDDSFDPTKDMIGSDENDAYEKLEKVKQGGNILFDEGNVFFLSTETMKRQHRDLHKIFSIFRQKNLFVLIVLPSFFRLGTYFALDRSKFLIRTYLNKGERSFFAYYGDKRKNKLYRNGKKMHDYQVTPPNFRGRFTKCLPLESDEYKKFKLKTMKEAFTIANRVKPKTPYQIRIERNESIVRNGGNFTAKGLATILECSASSVEKIRARLKAESVKNAEAIVVN